MYNVALANLVIANNATDSNVVEVGRAKAVTVMAPGTLTGTITIQASDDGSTFYTLKSGGSDVSIGVNAAVTITDVGHKYLRVHSSGAEGAARTFKAQMQEGA